MNRPSPVRSSLAVAGAALLLPLLSSLTLPASAQVPPAGTVQRPAAARGTVVVPDHFLRRWDPVTIFFAQDTGPAQAGASAQGGVPEDNARRYVDVEPAHPGAFTWLDTRTLQFRPAEPWPPLARFTWTVDGSRTRLTTLMAAPVETLPQQGASGLGPVESVTLVFPEPLDVDALQRMLKLELRPLPGIGEAVESAVLTADDFEIKVPERQSRADRATYVLTLRNPIPAGRRVVVGLRLMLDAGRVSGEGGGTEVQPEGSYELSFATAEPFRVTHLGCDAQRLPITPAGSRYTEDQAVECGGGSGRGSGRNGARRVLVEFSAPPSDLGAVQGRNLVRFEPSVENLDFQLEHRQLVVTGDFRFETPYRVTLTPYPLEDQAGRPLDLRGPSEVYLYFPRRAPYLRWSVAQGVVERHGPQRVPVEGRGDERLDLRIYPVDPLDRSFWPFPEQGVVTDEDSRPPGPGEAPAPFTDPSLIWPEHLREQLSSLGAPPVSELVQLPLERQGDAASFGLDLEPYLRSLGGAGRPGTYLVGLRRLDGSSARSWMRVQVTDLSVTTVEEPYAVRFAVTSLSTGAPIAGARVRVEAIINERGESSWQTVFEGTTDAAGMARYDAPGPNPRRSVQIARLNVVKGDDHLVLDPRLAPDGYANGLWSNTGFTWLQWTQQYLGNRGSQAQLLAHLFTERPVYRPDEPVHLKGYLRQRGAGQLKIERLTGGYLVVDGPGDLLWRYPLEATEEGSFYRRFTADNLPTGVYTAYVEDARQQNRYGNVSWRMEAYRIPRFEVSLHSDERVPLDREFDVRLTASYYAGGRVAGQPVNWRVTQFPYTWNPRQQEGFLFSSDGRFSRNGRFESTPAVEQTDVTDDSGSAVLRLNPALEASAQPRSYVVEATVTGADDQTVTATRRVIALPPFVLGLKVPRFLRRAETIEPQIVAVGTDNELQAGVEVKVRLLHRQWHSYLRASDFSDGAARYITDVVDEPVTEVTVTTGDAPVSVQLPITEAGVYIVEIEGHDRLGRAQVVSVDLYAGGDEPVTWQKAASDVFQISTDKAKYEPGDTATLVLQSPYQQGEALVVIEAPEGNEYRWLPVRSGQATLELPVLRTWVPRMPVHAVLMRGRVAGARPLPGQALDLGKPATVAATAWLQVEPVENRLDVDLDHPSKAQPGDTIEVTVQLSDAVGAPRAGEVTLWLVDQAVLALGREQRLDPLPDFISDVSTHLEFRDTRGMPFGHLPLVVLPGGGEGEEAKGILDRVTVRKNFQPVPYYEPRILVDASGSATVTVQLPDNLTNFKLRAKATSGPDRFGFATGHLEVRLPVIVQPALPRFVRPGDRFTAAAIGRVVEGEGGAGSAEVAVEGVTLESDANQSFQFEPNQPQRVEFDVTVPTPEGADFSQATLGEALFRVGVARDSDGAGDAFEVRLPIRTDRERVTDRLLQDLEVAQPTEVPGPSEAVRPGTLQRRILLSDQPGLVRMAAGLDFLRSYPYGCTEQRVSRARAYLATQRLRDVLQQRGDTATGEAELQRAVHDTLDWLPSVIDAQGRCAYWPGSRGSVHLTAWVVEFLIEAKEAGYEVDPGLYNQLLRTLEQALRSDYSGFISGEAWAERTFSLAALARAGRFDASYGAELARRSDFLGVEGVAGVSLAFGRAGEVDAPPVERLLGELWDGVVIRLFQGNEIYGGLQKAGSQRNGLILPSESRTLSEVVRSVSLLRAEDERLQVLINGLVTLGKGDGWGSTNANVAALLALSEVLEPPFAGAGTHTVALEVEGQEIPLRLSPEAPVQTHTLTTAAPATVTLGVDANSRQTNPVLLRAELSYVPAADGSQASAESSGFVVSRELLRISSGAGVPPERFSLETPGTKLDFTVGQVIEEHVQVVNPEERFYVAVVIPLAAGVEPLNPALATAPPEATPSGSLTLEPTYVAFLDDHVAYYYNTLPAGTYDFYFRTRATTQGSFIQPPAKAEMMYDEAVRGQSAGALIQVTREE